MKNLLFCSVYVRRSFRIMTLGFNVISSKLIFCSCCASQAIFFKNPYPLLFLYASRGASNHANFPEAGVAETETRTISGPSLEGRSELLAGMELTLKHFHLEFCSAF